MKCSKCGFINGSSAEFCMKCGAPMESENNDEVEGNVTPVVNNTKKSNLFFSVLAIILKPFTGIKEELNKFEDTKSSIILVAIVTVVSTILSLLQLIYTTVHVVSKSYYSKTITTSWVWDNMKSIDFSKVIGKYILIYLGIILGIAAIYYIARLIVKKDVKFTRLMSIVAIGIIPYVLCSIIVGPLLSILFTDALTYIDIIGFCYSFVLIIRTINDEFKFEGDSGYYINAICMAMIIIIVYIIFQKSVASAISSYSDYIDY